MQVDISCVSCSDHSAETPVRDSRNLTCSSLATIDVSFHSPSPMRKSRRLMTKAPVAIVLPPDCDSVSGTTTSRLDPLTLSFPATSNLPPPKAFTLLDWKMACGNCLVENQS